MMMIKAVALALLFAGVTVAQMPLSGLGTATVYDTSSYQHGTGACNCVQGIASYPTAALSQYYFGKADGGGAGPNCGKCFRLTVIGDPYQASWCPANRPSVVVKVADLCPAIAPNLDWCAATATTNNKFGVKAHFDLDQNTVSALTASGKRAFRIHFCEVSCQLWAGYNDPNANGQVRTGYQWGSCNQYMQVQAGQCSAVPSCGGGSSHSPVPAPAPRPAPAPAPAAPVRTATRPAITWNTNSNDYWFAIRVTPRPSSVAVNCGAGFIALTNPSWDSNSWESNNHCVGSFQLKINGNVFSASIKDTAGSYGMEDIMESDNNDEDVDTDETPSPVDVDVDDEDEAWGGIGQFDKDLDDLLVD